MKSALVAALLVSAAALVACESSEATAAATGDEREPEQEEESDSAPFMIVVEHSNGRRCGGSLVSLRTALTSAWCVRSEGGAEPNQLWALAPGAGASRRVARVALAAGAEVARNDDAWGGAALDLAVLELEAPFGGGARSRPILMATQPSECAASSTCHVVRALGRTPRLRIVDATLVLGEECAARAPGWAGLRESALCLVGPTLCSSDWGAGVVCEGKLCGVLSRSSRAADSSTEAAAGVTAGGATPESSDDTCGDTHVAQSVARWRRFLHCAHTLRACGRGGDCAQLCSERRLLDTDIADSTTSMQPVTSTAETTETTETTVYIETPQAQPMSTPPAHTQSLPHPVRLGGGIMLPTRSVAVSVATEPAAPQPTSQASPRPSFEFEPNRPDFKGGPARTSSVYLKAGEYGDNGAEYGGEEALLPTSTKASDSPEPTTAATNSTGATGAPTGATGAPTGATARTAAVQARVSARKRSSRAAPRPALDACLLYVLIAITNLAT